MLPEHLRQQVLAGRGSGSGHGSRDHLALATGY